MDSGGADDDTLQDFRSSTGRLPKSLRASLDEDASLTAAFWDVLRDTTGIFPLAQAAVARKAQRFNKSLKRPKQPAICTHRPPALTQDDFDAEELEEKQALQDDRDLASAEMDIAKFEMRIQQAEQAKKKKKDLKQSLAWSTDAEALYNMVAADQRLSKNAQLHSREYIVAHFRHLILSKMKVQQIDTATLEFANLRELNISQNAVRVLEHLPPGLQVLNAYANAVDEVRLDTSFHNLVFLGLGYNTVASMQTLQNLLPRLGTLASDPRRRPIRLPAGEAVRVPTQFAATSLDDNGAGSELSRAAAAEEWVAGRVLAPSVGPEGTPDQADERGNQTYDVSVQVAGSEDVDGAGRGRAVLQDVGDVLFDWNRHLRVHFFPRLRVLDLCFNALSDLGHTLQSLDLLEHLTHLSLMGNPLALVHNYRGHVLARLPQLEELDEVSTDDGAAPPRRPTRRLGAVDPGASAWVTIVVGGLRVDDADINGAGGGKPVSPATVKGSKGGAKSGAKSGAKKGGKKGTAAAAAAAADDEPAGPVLVRRYAVRVRFAAPEVGAEDVAVVSAFTELEVGGGPAPASPAADGDATAVAAASGAMEQRVAVPLSAALRDQVYLHALGVDVLVQEATKETTPSEEDPDSAPTVTYTEGATAVVGSTEMPVREWLDVRWRAEREADGADGAPNDGRGTMLRQQCCVEQAAQATLAAAHETVPAADEGEADAEPAAVAAAVAGGAKEGEPGPPPPARLSVKFELGLCLCD